MKKTLIILCIQLLVSAAFAKTEMLDLGAATNQIIQHYNKQKYPESLALLESIKESRNKFVNWYYYYALNHTRLNNYEIALINFETYVKNAELSNIAVARSYYYIGLIQFQNGEYEKALNSLEISLDISSDPRLDVMTEALIEKTLRYQNYFENSKKTNLTFLLGYNFDSNAINLSQDSFTDNLNGHVLNYGVSISHKLIDKYKYVFEPTVAILDNYTFDSQFKANSILQSADALQFLIAAPIRFYLSEDKFSNKYDVSLNAYSVYLPLATTTRELSLTSIFLKTQILTTYPSDWTIKYNITLASDQAYGYATEADDATGVRGEVLTTFIRNLSKENIKSLFFDIGADLNSAKGINARFKKITTALGYMYPSRYETVSSVRLGYGYLNYADKAEPRTDQRLDFSYNVNKSFASGSSLVLSVGAVTNSSNIALNQYSELTAGLQYIKSFGF